MEVKPLKEIIEDGHAPHTSHQDAFALELIGREGFFLDLGCRHPIIKSNSYLLEYYGWKGLLFDTDASSIKHCKKIRTNPAFCIDVNSREFLEVLPPLLPKDGIVDFISLDINTNFSGAPLVITTLLNTIEFKCMTYEHDDYHAKALGYKENLNRSETRKLFTKAGYFNLFPDVYWTDPKTTDRDTRFEDWWINPKHFPKKLKSLKKEGMFSVDIIKLIKEYHNGQTTKIQNPNRKDKGV